MTSYWFTQPNAKWPIVTVIKFITYNIVKVRKINQISFGWKYGSASCKSWKYDV